MEMRSNLAELTWPDDDHPNLFVVNSHKPMSSYLLTENTTLLWRLSQICSKLLEYSFTLWQPVLLYPYWMHLFSLYPFGTYSSPLSSSNRPTYSTCWRSLSEWICIWI